MAKRIYRTAMGKAVDVDALLLSNESAIAIGNMKVNARGDELGQGGQVVKTKAQVMQEYYALNTPVADDGAFEPPTDQPYTQPASTLLQPTADDTPLLVEEPANTTKPRGSLADSIAQTTEVKQELRDGTIPGVTTPAGVQRI